MIGWCRFVHIEQPGLSFIGITCFISIFDFGFSKSGAETLRKWLPVSLVFRLTRWKRVLFQIYVYQLSRRKPKEMRRYLLNQLEIHQLRLSSGIGQHRMSAWPTTY